MTPDRKKPGVAFEATAQSIKGVRNEWHFLNFNCFLDIAFERQTWGQSEV
jgi:hypothetical protein